MFTCSLYYNYIQIANTFTPRPKAGAPGREGVKVQHRNAIMILMC